MEAEQVDTFKQILEERLERLLDKAGSTLGQLTGQRDSLPDSVDAATEESNREFTLRIQEHERVAVIEIRAALKRIHMGEYGECVACGEEIAPRRLMARPATTHCIDCMTELEIRGRI